jgi:hypothetical protein
MVLLSLWQLNKDTHTNETLASKEHPACLEDTAERTNYADYNMPRWTSGISC